MQTSHHCKEHSKNSEKPQLVMDIITLAEGNTDNPHEALEALEMAAFFCREMYKKLIKQPSKRTTL